MLVQAISIFKLGNEDGGAAPALRKAPAARRVPSNVRALRTASV